MFKKLKKQLAGLFGDRRPSGRIRPATIEDVPAMVACIDAAYAGYRAQGMVLPPVSEGLDAEIRDNLVWVIEVGGAMAGCMIAEPDTGDWFLSNIAVAPHYAGRGIGRQLIAHLVAEAQAAGAGRIDLATHVDLPANVALYQHLGWSETGREDVKVHMSRVL